MSTCYAVGSVPLVFTSVIPFSLKVKYLNIVVITIINVLSWHNSFVWVWIENVCDATNDTWSFNAAKSLKVLFKSEYLLRGGRCASCVHAGGLSCFLMLCYCMFNIRPNAGSKILLPYFPHACHPTPPAPWTNCQWEHTDKSRTKWWKSENTALRSDFIFLQAFLLDP